MAGAVPFCRLSKQRLTGMLLAMSLLTIEVTIDHGRVTPTESFSLPEIGRGLLTILPEKSAERDPFTPHPVLSKGRILADPTEALSSEDWPETER
jgi:hypothetical protein